MRKGDPLQRLHNLPDSHSGFPGIDHGEDRPGRGSPGYEAVKRRQTGRNRNFWNEEQSHVNLTKQNTSFPVKKYNRL